MKLSETADGASVTRVDDGMRGVVRRDERGNPQIVYLDRGSEVIAERKEHWELDPQPFRRLRAEEIREIASAADRILRAMDEGSASPLYWLRAAPRDSYDPELVDLITDYLGARR